MNGSSKQLSMTHVQYEGTPPGSIFGAGEKITHDFLQKQRPKGKWINLGAGDGRYSDKFLSTCEELVAFDRDPRALEKLERDLSPALKSRLKVSIGDLTEKLPFQNASFDGAFCSATIHIFAEETVRRLVSEMFRIVHPGGKIVTDFLYDIKRVLADGSLYLYPGEISYDSTEAEKVITNAFQGRTYQIERGEIVNDVEINNGAARYFYRSKVFLVVGTA